MKTILTDWRGVFKLTDKNGQTHGGCQWGKNVTNPHGVRGGGSLCSGGFYHGYHTRELALLLNPLGACFALDNMRLWKAEVRGAVEEDKNIMKLGATEMRTLTELKFTQPSLLQRSAFGILVGLATIEANGIVIPEFSTWANNWLDGSDRSESAARSAARSAYSAARSASPAARSAESAARSAARSAESAAESAARSAESAARSAESAARSAESAARSAESAAESAADIITDAAVLALAQTWEESK